MLHYHGVANGVSPVVTNAGVIANGQGQQRPDFSPQAHFSSTNNSPVLARNGPMDLLALLKGGGTGGGGGGGGHGPGGAAVVANGVGPASGGPTGVQSNGSDNTKNPNKQRVSQQSKTNPLNNSGHKGQNNGTGNGKPGKPNGMQNFTFDVDALL